MHVHPMVHPVVGYRRLITSTILHKILCHLSFCLVLTNIIWKYFHFVHVPWQWLFQDLKTSSQFRFRTAQCQSGFQDLWLYCQPKAAAVILLDYCTPHNLPFMSLCPVKAQGYKVKVQSYNISASHFSSQPVMMTGWLVFGIVYVPWCNMFSIC